VFLGHSLIEGSKDLLPKSGGVYEAAEETKKEEIKLPWGKERRKPGH